MPTHRNEAEGKRSSHDVRRPVIVGLGEALFDQFNDKLILGGAPSNVAVHARQMLADMDATVAVATCVGQDELGNQLVNELTDRGVCTDWVQRDALHPTGRAVVNLNNEEAEFEILADAAWDFLSFDDGLQTLAGQCDAVAFGTLAQREQASRTSIQAFLKHCKSAIRLCDVNLRPPFVNAEVIRNSLTSASVAKLNQHELLQVVEIMSLPATRPRDIDSCAQCVIDQFNLDFVAVTRGERGTLLFDQSQRWEVPFEPTTIGAHADSVGAGDACCAALICGLLMKLAPEQLLRFANRSGAYVASCSGATPELPPDLLIPYDRYPELG